MALKWRGQDLFWARCSTDAEVHAMGSTIFRFLDPSLCPSCKRMYFDFSDPQPDPTTHFVIQELVGRYCELELRASTGCPLCSFVRSALLLEPQQVMSAEEWPMKQGTPVTLSYALPLCQKLLTANDSRWLPLVVVLRSQNTVHMVNMTFMRQQMPYVALTEDPMADVCLRKIRSWLDVCSKSHKWCKSNVKAFMPTRLLDLGASDDKLRIHICNDQPLNYVALSYCWGDQMHGSTTTTTSRNFMSRQKGFDANILSEICRDAIRLVRGLGLRYMWIDCLCIIQDNKIDWEFESALMGSIYQNAYVTLAAVAASSASEGFLKGREYTRLAIQFVFQDGNGNGELVDGTLFAHHPGPQPPSQAIYKSKWRSRAWTFQEEMLSTSILYCTPSSYYFECLAGDEVEQNLPKPGPRKQLPWREDFRTEEGQTSSIAVTFDDWYSLIENYSGRFVTVWQDILPALSGLAHIFAQHIGSKYIAGLWGNDIIRGLLWRHHPAHAIQVQKQPYRAPSWSWAAVPGSTYWRTYYQFTKQPSFNIEAIDVMPSGADEMASVKHGKLSIRGKLVPASVIRQIVPEDEQSDFDGSDFPLDWMRSNVDNPQFFWDFKMGWEGKEDLSEIKAVPIGTRGISDLEHHFLVGLLLKPINTSSREDEDQNVYERCGYFELDGIRYWQIFDSFPIDLFQII
ncbi:heterokaryon incompatibility protein [Glarea lozoyensis ATCC 20868]|uniref:Heterokaryon incompatibility protein n=1 Tax=Glarea lozoyensis (strain ATCC 20868 / MF5171) TaxID=1116229 RepID=S3DD90_GLAL2|nr:heterokaryon incompatibility protein [Glarea lozoyensis ATCC 20868]EPE35069.1 heterokaryon incompatibility protein [Glarea lozoyensis ATCC 20868]